MMKRFHIAGLLIALVAYLSACVNEPSDPNGLYQIRPLTYEEEILLKSSNEFSFELMRMLNAGHPDENILFSSLGVGNGIGMSLNILQLKPKEELKNFLKISQVQDMEINKAYSELGTMLNYVDLNVRFESGNSMWINYEEEFNPYSSDKIMAYYDADINYVNFRNPKNIRKINQWAENRTWGKITQVIDTVMPTDKSYIVNLLYFDISKAFPFEEISPERLTFNSNKGERIESDGLYLRNGSYQRLSGPDYTLLDIPLGKGQFNLTFIVPNQYAGLNKMISNMNPEKLEMMLEQATETSEDLLIPDFKINSEIRLKSLFPQFGLTGPLEVIKGYYYTQNLFISDFIHKTHFSLGDFEEDKTDGPMQISGRPAYTIDKPFLLIVRENYTGAMVFTGKMVTPVNQSLKASAN